MIARYLKILRAALVFTAFYVGGAVCGLVVLPLVSLTARDENERIRRNHRVVTTGFRFTLALLRWTRIFDFDPRAVASRLPDRPVLVVVNHPTTIDVVSILSVYRDAVVVIKDKIWNDPLLRYLFRWLGHVHGGDGTLASNLTVIEQVEKRLAAGFTVVIFPEGTRSDVHGLAPMQKGAFAIATRTRTDVLPVLIRCEPPVLHREAPWHHLPRDVVHYTVEAMDVVETSGLSTKQLQSRVVGLYERALGIEPSAPETSVARAPSVAGAGLPA